MIDGPLIRVFFDGTQIAQLPQDTLPVIPREGDLIDVTGEVIGTKTFVVLHVRHRFSQRVPTLTAGGGDKPPTWIHHVIDIHVIDENANIGRLTDC